MIFILHTANMFFREFQRIDLPTWTMHGESHAQSDWDYSLRNSVHMQIHSEAETHVQTKAGCWENVLRVRHPGARTVPAQFPYSSRTVPIVNNHSSRTFFFERDNTD